MQTIQFWFSAVGIYIVYAGIALSGFVLMMAVVLCCICICRNTQHTTSQEKKDIVDNTNIDDGYTFSYGQTEWHTSVKIQIIKWIGYCYDVQSACAIFEIICNTVFNVKYDNHYHGLDKCNLKLHFWCKLAY